MRTMIRMLVLGILSSALTMPLVAADGAKTPKGKGPVVKAGENVIMSCPHCKSDFSVKLTTPPKGAAPEKAVVEKHLCDQCSTKLVTKGAGKAKTEVAEHTCKNCK